MSLLTGTRLALLAVAALCAGPLPAPSPAHQAAQAWPASAEGWFEVTIEREPPPAGEGLGRARLDKRFFGDLEGSARGVMLTALTPVDGSAAYVAVERFSGTLAGREGSFLLVHRGVMDRGAPELAISVVPDSGTGGLAGLTGSMTIEVADGRHRYRFDYRLP